MSAWSSRAASPPMGPPRTSPEGRGRPSLRFGRRLVRGLRSIGESPQPSSGDARSRPPIVRQRRDEDMRRHPGRGSLARPWRARRPGGPYDRSPNPETAFMRRGVDGPPLRLAGRVVDAGCNPTPWTWVAVWHADPAGAYDNAALELTMSTLPDGTQQGFHQFMLLHGSHHHRPACIDDRAARRKRRVHRRRRVLCRPRWRRHGRWSRHRSRQNGRCGFVGCVRLTDGRLRTARSHGSTPQPVATAIEKERPGREDRGA